MVYFATVRALKAKEKWVVIGAGSRAPRGLVLNGVKHGSERCGTDNFARHRDTKKQKLLSEKQDIKENLWSASGGGASWFEPTLSILNQVTAILNALESTEPAVLADLFREVGLPPALRAGKIVFQPTLWLESPLLRVQRARTY